MMDTLQRTADSARFGRADWDTADISLLVEHTSLVDGHGHRLIEAVPVLAEDTVGSVRLLLSRSKPWFTSQSVLVCGDRVLLDSEVVSSLASATSGHDWLHLFVRLSDVQSLTADAGAGLRRVTYEAQAESPRRSALTDALAARPASSRRALPAAQAGSHSEGAPGAVLDPVLHLTVRRGSADVNWHYRGDNLEIVCQGRNTAAEVKGQIEEQSGLAADTFKLVFNGQVLHSTKALASYGVAKGSLLELLPFSPPHSPAVAAPPSLSPSLSSPEHGLHEAWHRARGGLAAGRTPVLASAGTGGSYFIPDNQGTPVAVFKPLDEEPLMPHNPRNNSLRLGSLGLSSTPLGSPPGSVKRGVQPGEGAVREVAAYLLDHGHFSGVPPTALVSCKQDQGLPGLEVGEVKVGSLQAFVGSDSDCEERGPHAFPTAEVHKIAVLDLRLVNADRNGANILARHTPEGWRLTPIDHAYCLPSSWQDVALEWQWWPQAAQPFDARTREYIRQLDADADLALLQAHGLVIRPECRRIFKVATMILKEGAARGCSPRTLGSILAREGLGKSHVEKMHHLVLQLACAEQGHSLRVCKGTSSAGIAEHVYLRHFHSLVVEYLDEIMMEEVHA